MPRRVALPGAAELFRGTEPAPEAPVTLAPVPSIAPTTAQASGRVKHDEKITVYVSADELLAVEHARLRLRAAGVAVDRGRLVRAAIASALADLEARGLESDVVSRLGGEA